MALETRITLRLPNDIRARYEKIAADANISISSLLRQMLSGKKRITIHSVDADARAERARLLRAMGNAGNNLNQIARHLNILAKKGELDYGRAIHFLCILDTIEARLNLFLETYDNADQS